MNFKKKNTFRITISNKKMTIDLIIIEISKTNDLENFKMVSKTSPFRKKYTNSYFCKKNIRKTTLSLYVFL